jgi:hypothetical protein
VVLFAAAVAAMPSVRAASGGHDDRGAEHGARGAPVPTGAALAERCAEYAETLAFTREQLKRRTFLGRSDLLRTVHRERERFLDAHCRGDAGGAVHARGGDHAGAPHG